MFVIFGVLLGFIVWLLRICRLFMRLVSGSLFIWYIWFRCYWLFVFRGICFDLFWLFSLANCGYCCLRFDVWMLDFGGLGCSFDWLFIVSRGLLFACDMLFSLFCFVGVVVVCSLLGLVFTCWCSLVWFQKCIVF